MRRKNALDSPCAVFDFDGTLVDSNGAFIRIFREFFEKHSIPYPAEFVERAKTMRFMQLCAGLKRLAECPESVDEIASFIENRSASFYDKEVYLKPGVEAYVRALKARGIRMCVASATDEHTIHRVLERLGIMECFDFVVTVEQNGCSTKDRPDIFIEAARRFGHPPSDLVVYDDALKALKAAKEAGLFTVGVYDEAGAATQTEAKRLCDAYIFSFEELL